MDKTSIIFGNKMPKKIIKKAEKSKEKFKKKFGDDSTKHYTLQVEENEHIGDLLGVKNLVLKEDVDASNTLFDEKGIVVGNIRMGFGHYRISMAIASAANSMGYVPYWMDLNSYQNSTCGKVINYQNKLYSMGSRMSGKSKLFNKYVWEPMNYEGFRKISYNASDQKNAELMAPVFSNLPRNIPFVATHVWPAQAAIHAGMNNVVNAIPDNWPMALHLAEGSLHTVQTYSSYYGYRTLNGMDKNKVLSPMGEDDIKYTGHYIDHELVVNIESDCKRRIDRVNSHKPVTFLLTIGGAGAQQEIFEEIIKFLIPYVEKEKAAIYVNVGDYLNVWKNLCKRISNLNEAETHFDNWGETIVFSDRCLKENITGIHAFYHKDIFEAVYATNLLMRSCDMLVTKPSELAFYPVPKLFIKRVGGHEQWGAIHSAEIGDGTTECKDIAHTLNMMKIIMQNKNILIQMNESIMRNKVAGVYDGAYKAVEYAVKGAVRDN